MPRLNYYLLGSPRLELDGQPLKLETRKTIALLAFLSLTGESYRRDSLVNLLWPDYDMTHGRGVLRRTLSALNAAIPEGWIQADRETIGLSPTADLWLDVRAFQQLLAECQGHGHAQDEICPDCYQPFWEAAALYREDFMSGFSLSDSINFDDWQFFQAEGLRQSLALTLDKLVRCLILRGNLHAAVEQARRRLALDRLSEPSHCDLMRLYAWIGQRSAALRQYQECRDVLQSQLGLEPQPTTTDLFHAIESGRLPVPPSDPAWSLEKKKGTGPLPGPSPESPRTLSQQPVEEKRFLTLLACELSHLLPDVGAERAPEEATGLLDQFLAVVPPILGPYGGIIERSLGASALIIFGLKHSRENDPEMAVRAALEIRSRCEQIKIGVSAGISIGEIYVRQENFAGKDAYRLEGAALEHALRIASQAPYGQIILTDAAYQLCRRAVECAPLPAQDQRSGPPLPVFRVDRLLASPQQTRRADRFRAGLVGRENELHLLKKSFENLASGSGQMVSLVGEAGLGKSRLVEELRGSVLLSGQDQAGPLWLAGRCLELSIDISYGPFVDLLKQYFSLQEQDDFPGNSRLVAASIHSLVTDGWLKPSRGDEMILLFGRLLAPRLEESRFDLLSSQSPEEIRQQTFLALRDFLTALSRRRPLVLVFEDLHWADRLSLDLISFLMESLQQYPIFLVCVYRPEQEYRTFHLAGIAERKCRGCFREFRLSELTRAQSFQMVDDLLGTGTLADRGKELVWERCQGNPFFIEEILQSLIETGAVYREGSQWKTRPFDSNQLPANLQSLILSRLDHLSEDWKQVLQTAAVIGRVFRRRILEQALRSEVDLDHALWELEGRGLIYQERAVPEEEFSFRHVLMQEAIYQNILRHRRRILHERAAEAIEALYPHNLSELAEQLAYHYEKSGNIKQTIFYLYQAGEKARASYSNEAAITHLAKGLELLRALPETLDRNRQELDFLILLGVPLFHARGHSDPEVLATYEDARRICLKLDDSHHLFDALLGLRRYFLYHGQIGTAHALSGELQELAEKHHEPYEQARACMMLAEVFHREGAYRESAAAGQQGMHLSENLNPRTSVLLYGNETYLGCQSTATIALWHLGWPDRARRQAEQQLALSESLAHPFTHEFTLYLTATFYMLLREPAAVQRLAEEVLRIADERGFAIYQAFGAVQLGWAQAVQGRVEAGLEWIQKGMGAMQSTQFGLTREVAFVHLGEALILSGQSSRAVEVLDQGLEALEQSGVREWEAEIYRLKADALRRQERFEEAEQVVHQAIQAARRQSSRGWELRAALDLARLWLAQGKRAAARDLVQPLYEGYTEGLDLPDLQAARLLLDQAA